MGKMYLNGTVYGGIIDFAKNVGQSVGVRDVTNLITPHSGITLASDFVYRAIQIGDIVFLSADGGIASGASSNDYVLFDIDSSILPVTRAFIWGYGGNSTIKYFRAFTDGTVHAQDGWCNFELYWQVAQPYYGNSVHNYSTEEQIVGTWIDGKPLYEKTALVQNISISSNSYTTVTLSDYFQNIGKLVNKIAMVEPGTILPTSFYGNSDYRLYNTGFDVSLLDNKIIFTTGSAGLTSRNIYVTLQYTKTTD